MISIVIVHWNTPSLLTDCLASIGAQISTNVAETIVVDCASSTGDVRRLVESFNHVRLIQLSDNPGYAGGCNAGFRETETEFVLFLNADVVLDPRAIETLVDCFSLNPRIGLVAPVLFNPDGTVQSSGYSFPGLANAAFDLLPFPNRLRGSRLNGRRSPGNSFHPYATDYALGAAVAMRSEALHDIGGWDGRFGMYSEEVDLCQRLRARDWVRLVEPRAQIVHIGGASTAQRPNEMARALWHSRGRYHRRWSSRAQRNSLRWLVEFATRAGPSREQGTIIRDAFVAGLGE